MNNSGFRYLPYLHYDLFVLLLAMPLATQSSQITVVILKLSFVCSILVTDFNNNILNKLFIFTDVNIIFNGYSLEPNITFCHTSVCMTTCGKSHILSIVYAIFSP